MCSRYKIYHFHISILLLCVLFLQKPIYSQKGEGGLPGTFLRLGVGARAVGLGGTFTAIANDASAGFWNPAGISTFTRNHVMVTYSLLSLERKHHFMAATFPLKKYGTIGFSWINLEITDIEGRNIYGQKTGYFNNSENAYLISWGFPISSVIHIGSTIKYLTHILENHQSIGLGFDGGILIKPVNWIQLGFQLQDISTSIQWDTENQTREHFPPITRVGLALIPTKFPITLSGDIEHIQNRKSRLHLGCEYTLIRGLDARVGYNNGKIVAGASISTPISGIDFQTDYSFGEDPIDQSYIHRFAISLEFSGQRMTTPYPPSDFDKSYNLSRLTLPVSEIKVIRIAYEHPKYAIINAGRNEGMREGMKLVLFRENFDTRKPETNHIGKAVVIKTKEKLSGIRVEWLKEGITLGLGDNCFLEKQGKLEKIDLQEYFKGLDGSFVLYDLKKNSTQFYNSDRSMMRYSPNSTFRILLTLMALDNKLPGNENMTFNISRNINSNHNWLTEIGSPLESEYNLTTAINSPSIWYYQQLVQVLGKRRIQDVLNSINYGNKDISGDLRWFWHNNTLKISAHEQVEFLKRFHMNQLGFSGKITRLVKKMIVIEDYKTYRLSGKTGSSFLKNGNNLTWFIGYVEKGRNVYFFALNIEYDYWTSVSYDPKFITENILTGMGILTQQ